MTGPFNCPQIDTDVFDYGDAPDTSTGTGTGGLPNPVSK